MYKIIGADQKEYGPVPPEDLRRWIAENRLNGQSLVRAEGIGEWKPLSQFPEFAEALGAQVGRMPPPGAETRAPAYDAAWRDQVLARVPEVQIGRCLGQSWKLLTANFGLLFGATALAWLIMFGCSFVPVAGGIINWLMQGVLYGGVYLVFLRRIRGQATSIGDVFAGFGAGFAQLMLVGFLTKLLTTIGLCCCLVLPGLYLFVAWIFSVPLVADKRLEFWSAMELSRQVVTRVWFEMLALLLVAFLPVILMYIFVQVSITCAAFPMIRDLIASGPPDVNQVWDVALHIAKVSFPLAILLKLVVVLNLPFAFGALMHAYEGLFGTRPAASA